MNREDILNRLRDMKPELARDASVRAIALFGSVARDEADATSDIDILVEFEKIPDLFKFAALQNQLSEALGVEVDLFTKASLHPMIRDRVLREIVYV